MKVTMNQQVSGTRDGVKWPGPGEELTVEDNEGAGLCAAGLASPVTDKPNPETRDEKDGGRKPETREQGLTTKNGPARS